MKISALLELLHPDGCASTTFVLGSNCPKVLFPRSPAEADLEIGLLILAPTAKECRSDGWLDEATQFVNQRLAADGICYLLVPPRWRSKVIKALSRMNLHVDGSFWHFPDWTSSHYLVPIQQGPALFAVDHIISGPSWKRPLARRLFRSPRGHRLLAFLWKSAGISVRRPGARPVFQWLFKREDLGLPSGTAIIRQGWRDFNGVDILYCFGERETTPLAVVKTTSLKNSLTCLDREAEVLDALGTDARSSGVDVPHILLKQWDELRSSLFLSPIEGKAASDLLTSSPDRLVPFLEKLVSWLERWNRATANVRELDAALLHRDFFAAAERLAPFLHNAEEYRDWLADRTRTVVGTSLPFVATHNDLTMANVLVDGRDQLGVVDWETGMAQGLPLVDFYYTVTDAIRIAQVHNSWLGAFKDCYEPNGIYSGEVRRWESRLLSATGLSSGLAELCFHACWLHHASNEHNVSHPGDPRPFLEIVQWLALNYAKFREN